MFEETANNEGLISAAPARIVSRRQLVKAGVWAAPVVTLAIASPAAAASGSLTVLSGPQVTSTGANRTVTFVVSVTGTTQAPTADLTWTRIHNGSTTNGVAQGVVTGGSGSYTVVFSFTISGNNGTKSAVANFYLSGVLVSSSGSIPL